MAEETENAPETSEVVEAGSESEFQLSDAEVHYKWIDLQRSRAKSEIRNPETGENVMQAWDALSAKDQEFARSLHSQE